MKKVVKLIILFIVLVPTVVNANIRCNDGTISPSCGDCHRGCCSHHGGCASGGGYSNTTRRTATPKPVQTPRPTPILTPVPTPVPTSTPKQKPKATQYTAKKITTKTESDDSSSVPATIAAIGGIGAGAYALSKKKKK